MGTILSRRPSYIGVCEMGYRRDGLGYLRCGRPVLQYDVAEEQHRLKDGPRVLGNCPGTTMMRRAMIEGKCGLPVLSIRCAEATAPACAGRHEDRPRVLSRECPGSTMMHWAMMEGKCGLAGAVDVWMPRNSVS